MAILKCLPDPFSIHSLDSFPAKRGFLQAKLSTGFHVRVGRRPPVRQSVTSRKTENATLAADKRPNEVSERARKRNFCVVELEHLRAVVRRWRVGFSTPAPRGGKKPPLCNTGVNSTVQCGSSRFCSFSVQNFLGIIDGI